MTPDGVMNAAGNRFAAKFRHTWTRNNDLIQYADCNEQSKIDTVAQFGVVGSSGRVR
jgi:hypothetical protein